MSCTYPMFRLSWSEHFQNNGWGAHRLAPLYEKRVHNDGVILQRPEAEIIQSEYPDLGFKMQQVPCGKCINCRLSYSRDWANRCMMELKTAQNALFVTLTYSDDYLEFAPYADPETGALETRPVLVPEHLQKYLKRIRRAAERRDAPLPIRFFACGEYGEETQRPHYHVILYNVPDSLIEKARKWPDSTPEAPLWTSEMLSKFWPYGFTVFGDVNWQTCAYVARYIVKKQLGASRADQIKMQERFTSTPWQHEFVRMSRCPGVGREYYDEHKEEIYSTDELFVPIKGIIQAVRPAKYYDRLYDVDHHLALRKKKLQRSKQAEKSMQATMTTTDLTEVEYLEQKDRSKIEQSRRLIRPTI